MVASGKGLLYFTPVITLLELSYIINRNTSCFFFSFVFVASCSSQVKYRQKPESLKFTAVVDSPSLIHAKNSYLQCNDVGFILMYN